MRKLFSFLSILITTAAMAQGVPEKHPTDTFQIGVGSSSSQKNFIFDLGLGGSNPSLGVDTVLGGLNYSKNILQFGDGLSSQKSFVANIGNGSTNPKIIWNSANTDWEFSNDGINFTSIGSGSGGASGVNLLLNPGFESGITQDWSHTGGTFTGVTVGSNLLIGRESAAFTASATGQSVQSTLHPVPNGLKGQACAVSMMYLGGDTGLTLKVLDNSSNVLASQILQTAPVPTVVSIPFVCPTSGSIQEVVASTSSAALIAMDQMFLGQNSLIAVSQSNLVGTVTWAPTASCTWGTSSATPVNFGANASCPTPTVTGNVSLNTSSPTATPSFQLNNLPPGVYFMKAAGGFYKSNNIGAAAFFSFSDGSSTWGATEIASTGTGANGSGTLIGEVNYPIAGNQVINLQGFVSDVSDAAYIDATIVPLTISVYRFPTQSEMAVRPQTINWVLDALSNNGGPLNLGTGTTSIPTDIQSGALNVTNNGTMTALQPCTVGAATGSVCGAGVGSLGVAFNLPATQDVLACAQFSHRLTTSATDTPQTAFAIYETDQNNTTQLQGGSYAPQDAITAGSSAIGVETPFNLCERLHFTSSGLKYVRLNFGQVAGGGIAVSELLSSPPVHWIIKPITQNVPAPILVGSVTSSSAGVEHLERASIANCTSDPCTISRGTPGISVVNWSGTGSYVVHFAPGTFTDTPACFFTNTSSATKAYPTTAGGSYSNLLYSIEFDLPTPVAANVAFDVMCMGPQ